MVRFRLKGGNRVRFTEEEELERDREEAECAKNEESKKNNDSARLVVVRKVKNILKLTDDEMDLFLGNVSKSKTTVKKKKRGKQKT